MFGLEDIMCYERAREEEEWFPSGWLRSPIDTSVVCWDVIKGRQPTRESTLKATEDQSTHHCGWPAVTYAPFGMADLRAHLRKCHAIGTTLHARFSVLDDWATALHTHHINDVIHGNLTPESVDVLNGRGTLTCPTLLQSRHAPWASEPPDDDVRSARWAATELFRIDNSNPSPTKMSDVYSFACLMLQTLTGVVPYCGTKRSEQVVYLKYLGREPIDARTPKVEDRHAEFMHRCWSPEPEKRPTMETVVTFIREEISRLGEKRD